MTIGELACELNILCEQGKALDVVKIETNLGILGKGIGDVRLEYADGILYLMAEKKS